MKKSVKLNMFRICLLIFFVILMDIRYILTNINYNVDLNEQNKYSPNLKTAKFWNLTGSTIIIDDSDPTRDWAFTVSNYNWCSGAGTLANPFVIENVTIDGLYSGSCIEIRNSNAHFIIRNCTLYNGFGWSFMYPEAGIKLDSVTNGKLLNNNCSFNNRNGIYLFYSEDITISDNILNNNYNGILCESCENINVSENIIEDNVEYGIYLDWSNWITLSENNMTNCGIGIEGPDFYITDNDIDASNLVNQKPVYFYMNTNGLGPYNFTNAGQVILLSCDNCLIENLNISRASCGIAIHYCNNITIRNVNSSFNSDRGIYLEDSDENIIYNDIVHNNGHATLYNIRGGIVLLGSSYNNISFNLANYNSKGIYMQNGNNNTLYNNTLNYNSKCGICVEAAYTSLYMNRMIECGIEIQGEYYSTHTIPISNEVNGKPIYYYKDMNNLLPSDFSNAGQVILANCNNALISDLDVSYGSCGISLFNCDNNSVSWNNASYNTIYGIFLGTNSDNNNISENKVIDNLDAGIRIWGDYNLISKNNIGWNELNLDSYYGIDLHGNFNNISGNDIICNNFYAILLLGDNNVISENNIDKNHRYGIQLQADSNQIINNNITNNGDTGIRIIFSTNNSLSGNLIENNTVYGIDLHLYAEYCTNNCLYNNFFIHNGIHAIDNSTPNTNFWDNGSIGNYWDDYEGVDEDDNGIGDTPYSIYGSANNQDNYPIWDDGIILGNLSVEISNQIISKESYDITFFVHNSTLDGNDFATIDLWWNGENVSLDVQNLENGYYFISLDPITINPGEDPILLNMSISALGFADRYFEMYISVYPCDIIQDRLDLEIVEQSFSIQLFNIKFFIHNSTGNGIDFATIDLWWNGENVSLDVQNLGNGYYFISLEPITINPGEPPILLNMTISAPRFEEGYYEIYIAVDPATLQKGNGGPTSEFPWISIIIILSISVGVVIGLSIFWIRRRKRIQI